MEVPISAAKRITVKLRYEDFKTITRSATLSNPTNITSTLWQEAKGLFVKWHTKSAGALRLLGFGVSALSDEGSGQRLLFSDPEEEKQRRLDKAFDEIRNRYGNNAVKHGK